MAIPVSREEKDFIRLLIRSEKFVPEREPNEWRLEQVLPLFYSFILIVK